MSLPAGGSDRRLPELRRRSAGEPLLSTRNQRLHASPQQQAPVLAKLPSDQPLRVLRQWRDAGGEQWLQVETADRRGWLAVA